MSLFKAVSDTEEQINTNTVKYITETLHSHTTFNTDINNNKNFILIFLFSGVKPDCEYKLYKYIRSKINTTSLINVILVDINIINHQFQNYYSDFFTDFTHHLNFSDLNTLFAICGKNLFINNNIYCIGIHPQHNDPLIKTVKLNTTTTIPRYRPFTYHEHKILFGMYDFFNIHFKNKPIIYVYNGNPKITDVSDYHEKYKVIDNKIRLKTNENTNEKTNKIIELKPPVIIIFCATATDPYKNILDTFKKGQSIFNIPNGDDVFASSITVKENDKYVYNSCPPDSLPVSNSNTEKFFNAMSGGYSKLLNKKYKIHNYKTSKKLITNHNKKIKKNKKTLKKIKTIKK